MHQLLVWSKRKGWLSPGEYPVVHREFSVGEFSPPDAVPESGALLVVDSAVLEEHSTELRYLTKESSPFALPIVAVGGDGDGVPIDLDELFFDVLPDKPRERELLRTLRSASHLLESQQNLLESRKAAEQRARELKELNAIGIALSAERDHERLLNLILTKSREITKADAGSLFLVESIDRPIGPENRMGDRQRVEGKGQVLIFLSNLVRFPALG